MKRFVARSVALLCAIVFSIALCKQARAQVGFSVRPPHINLELKPDGSQTAEVKIENRSSRVITIKAEAKDFAYDNKGNLELLSPEDGKYFNGCAGWISFKEISKKIAPGNVEQFQFRIRAPKKVKGGLYRTYLIFSTYSKKKSNIQVVGEIASLLKIKVPGGGGSIVPIVAKKGRLAAFESGRLNFGGSVPFVLRFENLGNVSLDADAIVEIRDGKNRLVKQVNLPKKKIKANEQYVWTENWKPRALFGQYRAIARVDAKLEKPWTKTQKFWVIKWQLLLITALIGIGAVVFGMLGFSRLRIVRKA